MPNLDRDKLREQLATTLRERFDEEQALITSDHCHYAKTAGEAGLSEGGRYHDIIGTVRILYPLVVLSKDPNLPERAIAAILDHQITATAHPHRGNYQWYAEDPECTDANAAFFVNTALLQVYLMQGDKLSEQIKQCIREAMQLSATYLASRQPAYHYTNACLSEIACALLLGQVIGDEGLTQLAEERLSTFYEYVLRRGLAECYTHVYYSVDVEALAMIQAFAQSDTARRRAKELTEPFLRERACFAGRVPVPGRRVYNEAGRSGSESAVDWPLGFLETDPSLNLLVWEELSRRVDLSPPPIPDYPRVMVGQVFDEVLAYSYLEEDWGLGAILDYPYIGTYYQADLWGGGWQDCPVSFSCGCDENNYGYLQLRTLDEQGDWRQHPSYFQDFKSRSIIRRRTFHPEVKNICHQHLNWMIVFTQLSRLDACLRRLEYAVRVPRLTGGVYVGGEEVPPNGKRSVEPQDWIIIEMPSAYFGVLPLTRTDVEAQENRYALTWVQQDDRDLSIAMPLLDATEPCEMAEYSLACGLVLVGGSKQQYQSAQEFTQYCRGLQIQESWFDDAEITRPYPLAQIRYAEIADDSRRLVLAYDYESQQVLERSLNGEPYPPFPSGLRDIRPVAEIW